MQWICNTTAELDNIAKEILQYAPAQRIWVLNGSMGAGKTTFVKALCRQLGVNSPTASPTFAIVNEYHTATQQVIFHFDFYRLKHWREALDIGIEEYFDSGAYCFLEWAERIEPLVPPDAFHVQIDIIDANTRIFKVLSL